MDSELVDEWTRPRLRVHSTGVGAAAPAEQHRDAVVDKKQAAICMVLGMCVLVGCAWIKAWSGFAQLLLLWAGASLILGPLAPTALTAGDCRVGQGETVAALGPPPPPLDEDKKSSRPRKHARPARSDASLLKADGIQEDIPSLSCRQDGNNDIVTVDGEWTEEELGLLRKQLDKHPRGTARRWQVIADSFGGARTVNNIILMAKMLAEKKPDDEDSYSKFLAQRKVSTRQISSNGSLRADDFGDNTDTSPGVRVDDSCDGYQAAATVTWSDAEDKALLAALKAFPKDTPSRWERIAETMDGRTRSHCVKRYMELRDGFRSSRMRNAAAE